jgi:hypothetical protein
MEFSLGLDGTPDSEATAIHVAPPEEVAVDWIGVPLQLWPPHNARTKYLLVKGESTPRSLTESQAPSSSGPDDQTSEPAAAGTAEWAVGVEARLDPVPQRWLPNLDKPRIGAGTNWLSLFDQAGLETSQSEGPEQRAGNP